MHLQELFTEHCNTPTLPGTGLCDDARPSGDKFLGVNRDVMSIGYTDRKFHDNPLYNELAKREDRSVVRMNRLQEFFGDAIYLLIT
jgi:hypothetical protein